MSWSIYRIGECDAIIKALEDVKPSGDPTQWHPVKAMIVAELVAISTGGKNAITGEQIGGGPYYAEVNASGHHDGQGNRNLSVSVKKVTLTMSSRAFSGANDG